MLTPTPWVSVNPRIEFKDLRFRVDIGSDKIGHRPDGRDCPPEINEHCTMTTLSSLNVANSLAAISSSNPAAGVATTGSVESQDVDSGSPSTIVTIPSTSYGSIGVYTSEGTLDGAATTFSWTNDNTDAVSSVMAEDYEARSISGQFQNLGSALLGRFQTTGSDFSQSVTVASTGAASAAGATGAIVPSSQSGDIELTVKTASGVTVDIELESENGTLGVSVKSSGQLTDGQRTALAKLAKGFQQAINGLGAYPPTLDLGGLTQYDTSELSSVNLKFNASGMSGDFSANGSTRSVSLSGLGGTMNLSVNTSESALLGSGAQRAQAIASYLNEFDSANAEGHGNAAMMAMFKDAFTQLNSEPAGAADTLGALPQSEQAMLTGLDDFTASITENTVGSPGSFSYQVSQTTKTQGDLLNGTISQTQQSHLKASYRQAQSAGSENYDDVQIDDNASSTVEIATEKGILVQASLSQSHSQSTRNSEYVDGKLVSDVTTPTNTSVSKNLLSLLQPFINDGEAARDSGTWQQELSTLHGMILLDASAN
jgi:hypothetical protein